MAEGKRIYPRAYSHVGITVSDLEGGVDFYRKAFGFNQLTKITELDDQSPQSEMLRNIYGPNCKKMRFVHLATSNGVGIKLIQFVEPKTPENQNQINYYSNGIQHLGVVDQFIQETVDRVVELGGKQKTQIHVYQDTKNYRMCFVTDPWGNTIEINTHPFSCN